MGNQIASPLASPIGVSLPLLGIIFPRCFLRRGRQFFATPAVGPFAHVTRARARRTLGKPLSTVPRKSLRLRWTLSYFAQSGAIQGGLLMLRLMLGFFWCRSCCPWAPIALDRRPLLTIHSNATGGRTLIVYAAWKSAGRRLPLTLPRTNGRR